MYTLRDKGTVLIGERSNEKVCPLRIRQRDVLYEFRASQFQLLPTSSETILRHLDGPGPPKYIGPSGCDFQTRRLW